jgi:hypothetical protein
MLSRPLEAQYQHELAFGIGKPIRFLFVAWRLFFAGSDEPNDSYQSRCGRMLNTKWSFLPVET